MFIYIYIYIYIALWIAFTLPCVKKGIPTLSLVCLA